MDFQNGGVQSAILPRSARDNSHPLDKKTIERLTQRNPTAVFLRSLLSVGSYVGLVFIASQSGVFFSWVLVWPLLGVILFGFSAAAHECIHANFARSRFLNHVAGVAWMTPLLLNYAVHRQVHLRHHSHATMEGDPERGAEPSKFNSAADYFALVLPRMIILKPLYTHNWRASLAALNKKPAIRSMRVDSVKFASVTLVAWLISTIVATFFFPATLVLGYWIPVAFFAPAAFTLLSLPEHYQTTVCSDPLLNTRSVTSGRLMRMLIWNINYHTAHHLNPKVPFHSLPTFDKVIGSRALFRADSYLSFHLELLGKGQFSTPLSDESRNSGD